MSPAPGGPPGSPRGGGAFSPAVRGPPGSPRGGGAFSPAPRGPPMGAGAPAAFGCLGRFPGPAPPAPASFFGPGPPGIIMPGPGMSSGSSAAPPSASARLPGLIGAAPGSASGASGLSSGSTLRPPSRWVCALAWDSVSSSAVHAPSHRRPASAAAALLVFIALSLATVVVRAGPIDEKMSRLAAQDASALKQRERAPGAGRRSQSLVPSRSRQRNVRRASHRSPVDRSVHGRLAQCTIARPRPLLLR